MGIYNRNGMIASLNESTRGFGPVEVCETFRVGDDLGWSCAKVCASIEEASNEWMREIGMEELEHATVFGEELIYEAEDASAKKNKNKFMAFISSVKDAVARFFQKIREKVAAFFAKFKKKKADSASTDDANSAFTRATAARQAAMLDNIETNLKRKAAEAIADEEAPMFSKTIIEVDNYLNLVSTNKIKEEVVDRFLEDLEDLNDEIMAAGNKKIDDETDDAIKVAQFRDKGNDEYVRNINKRRDEAKAKLKERKFDDTDVNDATGNSDSKFMTKYNEFKAKWISNSIETRKVVASMFISSNEELREFVTTASSKTTNENMGKMLTNIFTGDGAKKKIGNIMDNAPGTPWSIENMTATSEATEKNIESQLNEAMGKLQKQFTELVNSIETRAARFSETDIIAMVKSHVSAVTQMYMAGATAFTEAAISYIGYNKTLWNKYMVALEKVKAESKESDTKKESANEGYNFFGAFESIR